MPSSTCWMLSGSRALRLRNIALGAAPDTLYKARWAEQQVTSLETVDTHATVPMAPLHALLSALMASLLLACPLVEAAAARYTHATGITSAQEFGALKDQILRSVAVDLDAAWRGQEGVDRLQAELGAGAVPQKRMFVPLSGLPGELPTIKRQIRYHQCYFNPISCFRK